MEERGKVPPGLPKEGPTLSYWQNPPDEIANLRSTEHLPETADVVIVGSGISGATIAYNLLCEQPQKKIVLLEARQAASGASGRNGGHTKGASYRSFLDNVGLVGEEDAIKISKLEYDCMVAVHKFIAEHNFPCDARRCDTVDVFYDQKQWDKASESVKLMQKLMPDHPAARYTFYTPEETASKFQCPNTRGSLSYEAGSLSAYALTIGILKLDLAKGLSLQTTTPATSISSSNGHWTVQTPRGPITTPTLILATNGYTAHLLPSLQGVIVPFRGVVTAQRPGLSLAQTGLPTTFSFVYEKGYEYMITRPAGSKNEGDIVIGGGMTKTDNDGVAEYGNTDDTTHDENIVEYLTGCTKEFFGSNWGKDHPDGRVRHVHSGIMGYSGDGYPLVGPVPGEPGLFIDASFQGHGMVLCFLCAKAVSEMILGVEKDKKLHEWFPHAFRMTQERFRHIFRGRGGQGLMKKTTAMNGKGTKTNGVTH